MKKQLILIACILLFLFLTLLHGANRHASPGGKAEKNFSPTAKPLQS